MQDQSTFDQISFEQALALIPAGYTEGMFADRRWGVTLRRDPDDRRIWLFAEELAGKAIVSFNLYRLGSGKLLLKPCEMSMQTVVDFVHGYRKRADQPS
jgi:hypothetical protein